MEKLNHSDRESILDILSQLEVSCSSTSEKRFKVDGYVSVSYADKNLTPRNSSIGGSNIEKYLRRNGIDVKFEPDQLAQNDFHNFINLGKIFGNSVKEICLRITDLRRILLLYEKDSFQSKISADDQTPLTGNSKMNITIGLMKYRNAQYGFLQLFTRGEKKIIGQPHTRKFRMVACLFNPLNKESGIEYSPTYQRVSRVYGSITIAKDKFNGKLKNSDLGEMKRVIENTIKEIQKIPNLQGYITFAWNHDKTMVRMNLHEKEG